MSTRIHNGFRFPEAITLADVFAWRTRMTNLLQDAALEDFTQHFARKATRIFDRACLQQTQLVGGTDHNDGRTENTTILQQVFNEFHERLEVVRKENKRDAELDTGCSVVVLNGPDGRSYGMLFTENEHMAQTFWAASGVERFGYWDHCDGSDELDEKEWVARGKLWDQILNRKTPAEAGLEMMLTQPDRPIRKLRDTDQEDLMDLFSEHTPSFENRVRYFRNDAALMHLKTHDPERFQKIYSGSGLSGMVNFLFEIQDDAEKHPMVAAVMPQVEATLLPQVPLEAFFADDLEPFLARSRAQQMNGAISEATPTTKLRM